ncbi:MAG TPA: gliding motility-associated C-terminal domain-containing protein [Chitinophaga sp.]|uniref:T9SS type B sorting domain-containing protein n=1 Tax=Chitinophaga sp. TaxID=1869181 RepID=UPI002DBC6627|nr:gliding motility-associated C-terminal domain-containing protein [Chitinophaga sp.]HEU4554218.1 gliding motility-associated C-terminal domain-containing protein [Chitinophaga sp.]
MEKRNLCTIVWLFLLLTGITLQLHAQHIPLRNPSLEGTPSGKNAIPHSWYKISGTPDVQPGMFSVTLPPANGQHFTGMHSGPEIMEGIAQELQNPVKAGLQYTFSFKLAFVTVYSFYTCYGNLAVFGGNSPKDTAELLWSSGPFTHQQWKSYTAVFTPHKDYKYISLWAYPTLPCHKSKIGVAVLIDDLSKELQQTVTATVRSTPSCNNSNTGTASVTITGGQAPYEYTWSPGNYKTAVIRQVPPGTYQVTVKAANGVQVQKQVTVKSSTLDAAVNVATSSCYYDNKNRINVSASGGVPPYIYSLNGDSSHAPLFDHVPPGQYRLVVQDKQVCADTFALHVQPPPPLLVQVTVVPPSCSATGNGQLIPHVQGGGRPPFAYRLNEGPWQADSVFSNLPAGNYYYEVKDQGACSVSGTVTITSTYNNCTLIMPTAFSPNGDGNNDVFRPKVYDNISRYHIRIFNRWGAVIYDGNNWQTGWDGTYKGAPQDQQTYIYICTYVDGRHRPQELKGTVTLVR